MSTLLIPAVLLAVSFTLAASAHADTTTPLRIANVLIPASFAQALQDGLAVPVRLQYAEAVHQIDTQTDEAIGNATLLLQDGKLHLLNIDFSAGNQQAQLNDKLTAILSSKRMRTFSEDGTLQIDDTASMWLDLVAMLLTIRVSREAFGQAQPQGDSIALTPTVDTLTGVHRYNLGYSFAHNHNSGHSDSNFLQLDSVIGASAHHLALNASLYNLGQPAQSGEIYRAMYERDFDDRRIAAGMISTWDLQTLGVVTGLSTGRIYGASYGNQAQSRKRKADASTTPVQVFMPANGEVRVYREDRLISLQNLAIGNQNIDTSAFPSGIYNVTVEVYVDGRLTSTTTQRVTKLGGSLGFTQEWGWQWWGGMMEGNQNNGDSPLLGVSLARSLDTLELATTTYAFKDAAVGEARANWQATDRISAQLQSMLASDQSWRFASSLTLQAHDNASLWLSQEKLTTGSALSVGETELYSAGINLNLGGWISGLGQLIFNTTHDSQLSSDRSYVDYYQHLYAGRYGNLSMRASLQSDTGTLNGFNNKSITLDYSIPFDNLFSFGMSSNEQGQTTANLNYQKRMDGVINLASFNASRMLHDSDTDSMALAGTLGFEHKVIGGTMTLGRSESGDVSGNLLARGSLITADGSLLASHHSNAGAGIVVQTGIGQDGQMLAKVNGQDYSLQGAQTFLALQPYQEYEIELLNSKTGRDSYDINTGRQRYTLFPGNVATLDASSSIKEMVTVFGVIRAEDGSPLANARIDNHIGTTMTNSAGELSLDVDKHHPVLTFQRGNEFCETEMDLSEQIGAAWLGDIICRGLKTYASR
ncbi:fimbrial biogenesis outer membrane usher protein [Aeromonas hydrophila]|uniref:fimbrial biogenesis outer membrane usher protein n=1 Tax=Aeromonas hydrophila TaxID=644 RepID=UPI0029DB6DEB|nr:TcfC E-set like domain-containing protein [Aeromonas hydrophila]MDX7756124.1 TcfC E-set like domain-containing protein [Aeromonas hydrophila]